MSLEHDRRGAGEPLVLVHGIGGEWRVWGPVLDALAARHDVIAVSLPGHGGPDDGTPATVAAYCDRLERFFGEVGIERPHLAGNSTGGGIALELARRGSVRSATAVSPIGFWTDRERSGCIAQLRLTRALARAGALDALMGSAAGRTATLATGFGRPWRTPPDEARALLAKLARAPAFDATLAEFRRYRFSRGDELRGVPVTVAWGSRDALLYHFRQAPRARRMLPWARHVTLPGCGHIPFWDDPELCASVLLAGAHAA